MDDADRKLLSDIAEHGWLVLKVFEEEGEPAFAFSTGLFHSYRHPEILMIGLPPDVAHRIINIIGGEARDGKQFEADRLYDNILEGYDCAFVQVSKARYKKYLGTAVWFYGGEDFPTLQCVWPDRNGCFPWDVEAPEAFCLRQPILAETS
jgi:hypothetical protein